MITVVVECKKCGYMRMIDPSARKYQASERANKKAEELREQWEVQQCVGCRLVALEAKLEETQTELVRVAGELAAVKNVG